MSYLLDDLMNYEQEKTAMLSPMQENRINNLNQRTQRVMQLGEEIRNRDFKDRQTLGRVGLGAVAAGGGLYAYNRYKKKKQADQEKTATFTPAPIKPPTGIGGPMRAPKLPGIVKGGPNHSSNSENIMAAIALHKAGIRGGRWTTQHAANGEIDIRQEKTARSNDYAELNRYFQKHPDKIQPTLSEGKDALIWAGTSAKNLKKKHWFAKQLQDNGINAAEQEKTAARQFKDFEDFKNSMPKDKKKAANLKFSPDDFEWGEYDAGLGYNFEDRELLDTFQKLLVFKNHE